MQIFVFQFVAEQLPENPISDNARCAVVTVWALGRSLDRTAPRARHFVAGQGWTAVGAPYVYRPTREQLADLRGWEAEKYREALNFGISADFDHWPEDATRADGYQPAYSLP